MHRACDLCDLFNVFLMHVCLFVSNIYLTVFYLVLDNGETETADSKLIECGGFDFDDFLKSASSFTEVTAVTVHLYVVYMSVSVSVSLTICWAFLPAHPPACLPSCIHMIIYLNRQLSD